MGAPQEGNADKPSLPEDKLVALRGAAVHKIKAAATSGVLAQHPKLAILLSLWRMWGEKEDGSKLYRNINEDRCRHVAAIEVAGRTLRSSGDG